MSAIPINHLDQVQLSRRWHLSPRTLERWRWMRHGPRYLRIGGRVLYRLEDVEAYEAERVRATESDVFGSATASRQERRA